METVSRFIETAEERAELRQVAAAVEQAKTAAAAAEVIGLMVTSFTTLPTLYNSRSPGGAALAQLQANEAVVHRKLVRAAARF